MEGFKNLSITIDNKNYSIGNMYNMTMADLDYEQVKMVVELFSSDNKVLSEPAYTIIIVVYTVLVTIAGYGNIAVMFAVLRRKEMRTARNIFIFNLAMSDLLMATSIPFTVIDGLTKAWDFPESLFACRYRLINLVTPSGKSLIKYTLNLCLLLKIILGDMSLTNIAFSIPFRHGYYLSTFTLIPYMVT